MQFVLRLCDVTDVSARAVRNQESSYEIFYLFQIPFVGEIMFKLVLSFGFSFNL